LIKWTIGPVIPTRRLKIEATYRSSIATHGDKQGALPDFEGEPSVGYAEGYRAGRTIEAPAEVATLVMMFDHLRALALSPADSWRMISSMRGEYE
jgi:hypothetical protein